MCWYFASCCDTHLSGKLEDMPSNELGGLACLNALGSKLDSRSTLRASAALSTSDGQSFVEWTLWTRLSCVKSDDRRGASVWSNGSVVGVPRALISTGSCLLAGSESGELRESRRACDIPYWEELDTNCLCLCITKVSSLSLSASRVRKTSHQDNHLWKE